jgi:hypothetical protein
MSSTNPLSKIWVAYQTIEDSFKMSRRVIKFAKSAAERLETLKTEEPETTKTITFIQYKAGKNFLNRILTIDCIILLKF